MRRADRLFDIIQLLRRNRLVRAQDLAETLEVSERTIYRDIAALIASGVPIEGEAGVGYILRGGFDLPPLMFDTAEIEALVLGAQIVEGWADGELAAASRRAMAKIEAVLPDNLRAHIQTMPVNAPGGHWVEPMEVDLAQIRHVIRARLKLRIQYCAKSGAESERVIRPLLLSFFGPIWTLTSWCELRCDFRTFRLDFIRKAEILEQRFEDTPGQTLADLMARAPEDR